MDNITFCEKLWDVAEDFKTVYMKGVFGAPVNEYTISSKAAQYPSWYTPAKQAELRKLMGKNYFGFDCVCLIKGILWGWSGESTHIYGGAKYASNGVKDLGVEGIANICSELTSDFSSLQKGELLFMPGHVGVYLGDGLACECTPIWKNGVQITGVKNTGHPAGYNGRTWKTHGKLAHITYRTPAVLGDVDGDGRVTARDYTLVRDAVLGKIQLTPPQLERADINCNGVADATDYLIIRRIYLGMY